MGLYTTFSRFQTLKKIWASPILECLWGLQLNLGFLAGIPKMGRAIRCNSPLSAFFDPALWWSSIFRRPKHALSLSTTQRKKGEKRAISATIPLAGSTAYRFILLAALTMVCAATQAQSLEKQVIAAQGESNHAQLIWTLGEIATEPLLANNLGILQGFQAVPSSYTTPATNDCNSTTITTTGSTITFNWPANRNIFLHIIRKSDYSSVFTCSTGNNCVGTSATATNLTNGEYICKLKLFSSAWAEICKKEVTLTVNNNTPAPFSSCSDITAQYIDNQLKVSNLPTTKQTTMQITRISPTLGTLYNCMTNCSAPVTTVNNPMPGTYIVGINIYNILANGAWSHFCAKEISLTINANSNLVLGQTLAEQQSGSQEIIRTGAYLYPNPTSEEKVWLSCPIQSSHDQIAMRSYTIWNMLGQKITTQSIPPEETTIPIDLSQLTEGMYQIEVHSTLERSQILPLVITKR